MIKIFSFIFISLFYSIGILRAHDTIVYYIPFYEENTWRTFEPGFYLINSIGRTIGLSSDIFIFILSFTSIIVFLIFLEKILNDKRYYPFVLFFLFSTLSFNLIYIGVIRQAIALSIITVSIFYFIKNKTKYSFIWLGIATTIHYFSIVFFLMYFFQKYKRLRILFFLASFMIALSGSTKFIDIIFGLIINFVGDSGLADSLNRVKIYTKFNAVHSNYLFKYLLAVINFLILYLVNKKYCNNSNLDKQISFLTALIFIASCLYFTNETSIRFLYIFNILSIISWVTIVRDINVNGKSLVLYVICIFIFVYSFFTHDWISFYINRVF